MIDRVITRPGIYGMEMWVFPTREGKDFSVAMLNSYAALKARHRAQVQALYDRLREGARARREKNNKRIMATYYDDGHNKPYTREPQVSYTFNRPSTAYFACAILNSYDALNSRLEAAYDARLVQLSEAGILPSLEEFPDGANEVFWRRHR